MIKLQKQIQERFYEHLKEKGNFDTECESMCISINEIDAKIEHILKNADDGPGGGIYDVLEYDLYTEKIKGKDGILDLYDPAEFHKDEAYYFLEYINAFSMDNLQKTGLLQNVSPEEFEKSRKHVDKLIMHARKNLIHLNLKTLDDLWNRNIYNIELLCSYMKQEHVKKTLAKSPFAIDRYDTLAIWGLHALDEFKEIGILQNIPETILSDSTSFDLIFKHAQSNLQLLGIDSLAAWNRAWR